MKNPFELKPLLMAGIIGAGLFYLIAVKVLQGDFQSSLSTLPAGFVLGAGVQIGVRLTGVS